MSTDAQFSSVQRYPLANDYWTHDAPNVIFIHDVGGQQLLTIPCAFLLQGRVHCWNYVVDMTNISVEQEGSIFYESGQEIDYTSAIAPGRYLYLRKDDPSLSCTFRRGPEGKRIGRPVASASSSSTYSNSRRSSNNQNKFRELLIYRDGDCLFTGESFQACTAAHIVPVSRPDLYSTILQQPVNYQFHAHMGLLLRDDIHHSYDRFEWSLHCQGENYIIHYFTPSTPAQEAAHGHLITPARFRGQKSMRPNAQLLAWHYAQCVMMHLRGFSHRMGVADALASAQA